VTRAIVADQFIAGRKVVWGKLDDLFVSGSGKRRAAIAYLGADAALLLHRWRKGDLVICDASKSTLQAGSTHPAALEALIERGVRVVSVDGLHAKVVVVGTHAAVGSMNASKSSAGALTEAVIVTESEAVVKEARRFVDGLVADGTEVNASFIKMASKQYRPPHGHSHGGGGGEDAKKLFRLHIRHTEYMDPPTRVAEVIASAEPALAETLTPGAKYWIDSSWGPTAWCKEGDWVLWIDDRGDGNLAALPPQRCMSVIRAAAPSKQRVFLFRALSRGKPCTWDSVQGHVLTHAARAVPDDGYTRDARVIDAVLGLWGLDAD
jgi:hypothetical protein